MESTHVCLIYYIWILPTLYDRGYNVASINLKCRKEANKIHYDILVFPTKKSWPDMSTEKAISNLRLKNPWNIYHRFPVQTTPALKEIWCTGPCGRKRRSLQCILSSCLHRAQPNEDSPVLGAKIIGTMTRQPLYPTQNIWTCLPFTFIKI